MFSSVLVGGSGGVPGAQDEGSHTNGVKVRPCSSPPGHKTSQSLRPAMIKLSINCIFMAGRVNGYRNRWQSEHGGFSSSFIWPSFLFLMGNQTQGEEVAAGRVQLWTLLPRSALGTYTSEVQHCKCLVCTSKHWHGIHPVCSSKDKHNLSIVWSYKG